MSSETGEESTYHVDPRVVMNALEKIRRAKRLPHAGGTTLCKLCLDMSTHILGGNSYAHIPNLWNLPIAAASCSFCSLVEQCIRAPTAVNRDALDFAGALQVAGIDEGEVAQLVIRPDRNLLDLCFIRQGEVEEELLTTSTIRLFTDSPLSANREEVEVPLGMIVPPVPDLSNVGDLVKTWMEDCRLNHLECNAPGQAVESRLPTRVLDIDQVHRTGRLQLLHTNNIPGKYIALSHSWGGHQPAKTVGSNLVARCAGFPFSELPPTFRDAIAVAIQIDIRYIWIDSLCIVQDDPEDWKREAAMMGDVYLHSYLTIAATRAANSEAGFLGPRISTHTAELPSIALKVQDHPTQSIYACQRRSFTDDVDDGLLNRRAWVLQERVLSPRTLHFTEHQVYWECWQYHQGEDLEYEYLGVMKKEAYPVQLSPSSLLCDAPRRSSELPRAWWHISSEYSSLGLTFQTDKLVAISGLVQKLESQLHMTYMKGAWKELLHPSVLWSARAEDLEYLPLVGAPSWSWASRKGPIHFMQLYDYDPSPNFTVREADPTSSSSGSLFVQGTLAKLKPRLRISDVRWSDPVTDQVSFPPEIDYHAARYRVVQGHEGDILGWITLDVEVESQNGFPDLFWVLVARDSHLHQEARTGAATPPHEEGQRHFYILVQKNADGLYKRVGVSSMGDARYLDYCNESALIS
ncbi:heterokaryon incompatibility protein-domain-containing protein [Xylaria grammica]|nr:heterokaryon incompatibility protein-domain-containing protein [Xylaria grammica]